MRATLLAALLLTSGAETAAPRALEDLADAVTAQALTAQAEGPLAVAVAAPGAPSLQQAFQTMLLARLAAAGLLPHLLPAEGDSEALARAAGCRALLRVRLRLDGNLTAAGDLLSTWKNFFSGSAAPGPARPAAVVFAEVAADAAVRALGQPTRTTPLLLEPEPLAHWEVRTAALAAGELGGQGRTLLAILTEEAVEVRALDGRLLARRSLEALPRAELPSREPFGTLCVCQGLLYAYSAGRSAGEVLALVGTELVPRGPLLRPVAACGDAPLEAALLPGRARLSPVGEGWPALPQSPLAWGLSGHPSPAGTLLLLLREDGTAHTQGGTSGVRTFPGVGAGAALADVSGDGTLRLAASSTAAAAPMDRLRLLGLTDGTEHGAVDVPGRILQVAAAAPTAGGPESLVLGVWRQEGGAELRLVRSER